MSRVKVAAVAAATRRELGISEVLPITDLFSLLDGQGVRVIRYPFGFEGNTSALLARHRNQFFVVVDSARTLGHQRFSAAHEYGHFQAHRDRLYFACAPAEIPDRGDSETERFADRFAVEFLMPRAAVESWLASQARTPDKPSLHDVVRLQQAFGVSYQAMVYRVAELGLVSADLRKEWEKESPLRLAKRWGLPGDLYHPDRAVSVPGEYQAYWIDAYEEGLVTFQRLAAALRRIGVKAEDLELRHPVDAHDVT